MSPFVALAGVMFRRDRTFEPTSYSILARAVAEVAHEWGKSKDEEHDLLHDLLVKLYDCPPAEAGCGEEVLADEHRLFCSCLQVARNHLTDGHRKTRRVRTEDPAVLDSHAGLGPSAAELAASQLNDLDLGVIGHKKTEEVMRHLLDGRTVAEIAKTMHMTPRNVLRLKNRGAERLNTRYNRDSQDHPG